MKIFTFILSILLFSSICNEDDSYPDDFCLKDNPSNKKDCYNRKLLNEKNDDGDEYKYCCYFQEGNEKSCVPITQSEYNNRDELLKQSDGGILECYSYYIKISIIGISLFFL